MKTKKLQIRILILLSFFIILVFSCSSDNAITNSSDQIELSKPNVIFDVTSINSNKPKSTFEELYAKWILAMILSGGSDVSKAYQGLSKNMLQTVDAFCLFSYIITDISDNTQKTIQPSDQTNIYKFRDNYLSKSEKGQLIILSYYLLSIYGIENNLVMRNPLKHLSIMETGLDVSKALQHGTSNSKILINKNTYDELKELSKIYRNSDNHKDIEPVLDYLETDLEKYYNKPKAEIAADFGF